MRQINYILIFSILASCRQSNLKQETKVVPDTTSITKYIKNAPIGDNQKRNDYKQFTSDFKKATLYKLTDTIFADFNGDGVIDNAFYKKENGTSGVIIKHGQTDQEFRIGFGKSFSSWTNDFDCNWVDFIGLVEDKVTSETTFTDEGDIAGSKEIKLENPAIVLGKDEIGGGLITFLKGKYVWIHQTC